MLNCYRQKSSKAARPFRINHPLADVLVQQQRVYKRAFGVARLSRGGRRVSGGSSGTRTDAAALLHAAQQPPAPPSIYGSVVMFQ
jgi:hypothetical protein